MTGSRDRSTGRHVALWWKSNSARLGWPSAGLAFLRILWDFTINSLPEQRRRRYGDADYDWDYRVNTTSGSLTARERFIGLLHSPYQPTEPALFHEILRTLLHCAPMDLREFTFVDIGSGKGRTLLMASDYPFHRIIGVELIPSLHKLAEENFAAYKNENQQCFNLCSICADAARFEFPPEPAVLYLFNPLPEPAFIEMLQNLELSLRQNPRSLFLIYHNPLLEHQIATQPWLERTAGTQQFAVYRFRLEATGGNRVDKMR